MTLPKNGEIKKDASKTSTNADQSKSKSLIEDPEKLKMITNLESEVKQLKEQLELKNKQIIELKEDNLNCL